MTNPIEYGVINLGFKAKRLIDIKNELENAFIQEFSEVNLDPQSVIGQLIGIYSKALADIWENLEDVYFSQYPNSASGISLDNVVQLNGITRRSATKTSVIGVLTGNEGTLIPAGTLARIGTNGAIFSSTADGYITRGNTYSATLQVNPSLLAQRYLILLGTESFFYARPTITFSSVFGSDNIINIRLNGVNLSQVPFNTNQTTTMQDIADELLTSPAVASATVVGLTIEVEPTLGYQLDFNLVNVTGTSAPSASFTFRTPSSVNDVRNYLSAVIDASATYSSSIVASPPDGQFIITAGSSATPYILNFGSDLSVISVSSPINFLAQEFGVIPAPANSLNTILTPIAGWTSITNPEAGVTGSDRETDAELRIRRLNSLRLLGAATVEAIRARLLQEVPGVSSVTIFENVTMTQTPIQFTFSAPFVTGNLITPAIDGNNLTTILFTTNHLNTMNLIAAELTNQPEILSAVVSGSGNLVLTVNMEEFEDINLGFTIVGGASQPTYSVTGGRPPKSFETVVQGGTDQAVANQIWLTKPAGIETFGNVNGGSGITITDSQGNPQVIHFSRATPVYIFVQVVLTLNPQEVFPSNGQQLVAAAILAYGNSLGIGVDVFIQRVLAQVFTISGIASATVQLARTLNPSDTPSYASNDVDISETEVSVWDLSRIFVSI